jgi:N-methylhydantoinase B
MTDTQTPVDPITRAVIEHRLNTIVVEMGEAMLRASYSQILNASRDFSIAIIDTDAQLIAQADHIPVHVGALPWAVRAVEARFVGDIAQYQQRAI